MSEPAGPAPAAPSPDPARNGTHPDPGAVAAALNELFAEAFSHPAAAGVPASRLEPGAGTGAPPAAPSRPAASPAGNASEPAIPAAPAAPAFPAMPAFPAFPAFPAARAIPAAPAAGAPSPAPPADPSGGRFSDRLFAAAFESLARAGAPSAVPGEEAIERGSPGLGATPAPSLERASADAGRATGAPAAPSAEAPPGAPASADEVPAFYWLVPPAAPKAAPARAPDGDVSAIRADFPALSQTVHGRRLVWLDNAATTQKPRSVIEALSRFYERDNSNIHRGAHDLARRATEAYENAREAVRRFLGAAEAQEIVFTRGTTEAINLVAQSWGRQNLGPGDEVLLTTLEHHANIVPWQMVAREKGAVLKVAPVSDRGELLLEEYARLLSPRTKVAAFPHVSNALGTVLPVREMAEMARRRGAVVLVDGAQSVPHLRSDVQEIGADFFAFSGHKLFGPTGVGVLYGRRALLESMPPWQGGGSMIRDVTFEKTTYSDPPAKFEAGTPTIADAVGLAAAIEYVERLGMERIARREHELLEYATGRLAEIDGLRMVGTAPEKASVLSFVIAGTRVEDVARHLDSEGIAVRAGHHCAQPSMRRMGLTGTVRPSLALYNDRDDVDALVAALRRFRSGA